MSFLKYIYYLRFSLIPRTGTAFPEAGVWFLMFFSYRDANTRLRNTLFGYSLKDSKKSLENNTSLNLSLFGCQVQLDVGSVLACGLFKNLSKNVFNYKFRQISSSG